MTCWISYLVFYIEFRKANLDMLDFYAHYYKRKMFIKLYSGHISPVGHPEDWQVPNSVTSQVVNAPVVRTPFGRSKRAFGMMKSDSLFRDFNWVESLSSILCVFSSWKVTFSGNHSPLFWWNHSLQGKGKNLTFHFLGKVINFFVPKIPI